MIMTFKLLLTAAIVVIAITGCPGPGRSTSATAPMTDSLDIPVPPFEFTERSGTPIRNATLAGKVWIASFVFTRCSGPCPATSATMARLQDELKDMPGVMLVTFTIDPARDTRADLNAYADRYRADPARWLFATGDEAAMHSFATQGFKLLAKRADTATPKPGEEFDHSSKLALVNGSGMIVAYYDGMAVDPAALDATIATIKARVSALVTNSAGH
jgi:protein SCO1